MMSEKRFTLSNFASPSQLSDVCDGGGKMLNSEVVDCLNEQQATNDYLEETNSRLQVQLGKTLRLVDEQQATIEQKDKQLERLYNYFQYYLKDEMSGNAFSEMWDFVKEDEDWEDE